MNKLKTQYDCKEILENGEFSTIFRVASVSDDKEVALKVYNYDCSVFRREHRAFQALGRHENVVGFKEHISVYPEQVLVLELCQMDLRQYIDDHNGRIEEKDRKILLRQLFNGLQHIHSNGYVHLDIKTQNLLIIGKTLKIADFGLATKVPADEEDSRNEQQVSLWYRPIEIALGEKKFDYSADMWSAGCVMAELITGEPIFKVYTDIELINRIIETIGSPDASIAPEIGKLPIMKYITLREQPINKLRDALPNISDKEYDLINNLLCYNVKTRLTSAQAGSHSYFENE